MLQVHPQFDPPQVAAPKFAPVSTWLSDGAGHALPHEPQFCTSDDNVLHDPEHPVCPVEQLRQALLALLQPFTHDMTAGVTQVPALQVPWPYAPLELQVGPLPQFPVGKTHAPSARLPQVPPHVPLPAQALREP